jgi:hypothetical protein
MKKYINELFIKKIKSEIKYKTYNYKISNKILISSYNHICSNSELNNYIINPYIDVNNYDKLMVNEKDLFSSLNNLKIVNDAYDEIRIQKIKKIYNSGNINIKNKIKLLMMEWIDKKLVSNDFDYIIHKYNSINILEDKNYFEIIYKYININLDIFNSNIIFNILKLLKFNNIQQNNFLIKKIIKFTLFITEKKKIYLYNFLDAIINHNFIDIYVEYCFKYKNLYALKYFINIGFKLNKNILKRCIGWTVQQILYTNINYSLSEIAIQLFGQFLFSKYNKKYNKYFYYYNILYKLNKDLLFKI